MCVPRSVCWKSEVRRCHFRIALELYFPGTIACANFAFSIEDGLTGCCTPFDPRRIAILLIGGDKSGRDRWYEKNVPLADRIYDAHLAGLKKKGK